MSCNTNTPPNCDQQDSLWDPILDIPLSRVHICTLHARLRIMDKLLKLHINYAWNMEPEDLRKECISKLEDALSSLGLHGGAVTLSKYSKRSGQGQDNPNKVCMGGSKARHLLTNHTESTSHTEFEIWKNICDCTTYRRNNEKTYFIHSHSKWLMHGVKHTSPITWFVALLNSFVDLVLEYN